MTPDDDRRLVHDEKLSYYTARTYPGRLEMGASLLCRTCKGSGTRGIKTIKECKACNGYGIVPNRGPIP